MTQSIEATITSVPSVVAVAAEMGSEGQALATTASSSIQLARGNIGGPIEYKVDGGPWIQLDRNEGVTLPVNLAVSAVLVRKATTTAASIRLHLTVNTVATTAPAGGVPIELGGPAYTDAKALAAAKTGIPASVLPAQTVDSLAKLGGFDVVALMGQSNMQGPVAANAAIDIGDPMIFQLDGLAASPTYGTIIPAVDPLQHPSKNGIGPGLPFARAYVARTGRPVLLVPTAWGGTNMVNNPWNPSVAIDPGRPPSNVVQGSLYYNAIYQCNLAMSLIQTSYPGSRFAGILFGQGESDVGQRQSVYEAALTAFINNMRANITGAANSWFLINMMNPEATLARNAQPIDAAHRRVASALPRCGFVYGPAGYYNNDTYHWTAPGLRILGVAGDAAVLPAIRRRAAFVPGAIQNPIVRYIQGVNAYLSWEAPNDGGPITDYAVQWALAGSGGWQAVSRTASTDPNQLINALAAGTSLDYRVAAIGLGGQGLWSSIITSSTGAAQVAANLRMLTVTPNPPGNVTETGSAGAYTYTATGQGGKIGNPDKSLPANTEGGFDVVNNTLRAVYAGLVASASTPDYSTTPNGFVAGLYPNPDGFYRAIDDGAVISVLNREMVGGSTGTPAAAGDVLAFRRGAGGKLYALLARAATPTVFAVIHEFKTTSTAQLWFAVSIGSGSVTGPIKGYNVV